MSVAVCVGAISAIKEWDAIAVCVGGWGREGWWWARAWVGVGGGRVGGWAGGWATKLTACGLTPSFYAARLPRRALGLKAGSGLFWSAEMTKLAQSHANRHAAGAPFAEPTLMAAALGVVWMGRRSSISPHDHARMRGIA